MNKRHYEHTLPNIRGSLSNTYRLNKSTNLSKVVLMAFLIDFHDLKIRLFLF